MLEEFFLSLVVSGQPELVLYRARVTTYSTYVIVYGTLRLLYYW